jgi:hypothetical protein
MAVAGNLGIYPIQKMLKPLLFPVIEFAFSFFSFLFFTLQPPGL